MTPFIPELSPWSEERRKALPASIAASTPCREPADPDRSMPRPRQRRIAATCDGSVTAVSCCAVVGTRAIFVYSANRRGFAALPDSTPTPGDRSVIPLRCVREYQ